MTTNKKQIWLVCTGNTCRSPMAEGILRTRLGPDAGWTVYSAGLAAGDGMPANETAVRAMKEWGYDLTGHSSRALTRERAERADRILVMTEGHRAEIAARWPDLLHKVFLLNSFGLDDGPQDILDPIGLSIAGYRQVRDQIDEAVSNLILYMSEQGEIAPPSSRKEI